MRLNVFAVAAALALVWGGGLLLVACAHLVLPRYGMAFLEVIASVYPGYDPQGGLGSIFTVTVWGLVDGFIAGAMYAWLYNAFARRSVNGER